MWNRINEYFEIQCNTEGLQIDKAGINTKIQLQMDNRRFYSDFNTVCLLSLSCCLLLV